MESNAKDLVSRLAAAVRRGDPRAIGRALTLVENDTAFGRELMDALEPATGRAHVIGITGPPGVGKSTLIDAIIHAWRRENQKVAVLAVDPVSPLSGGALLGDRIRMGAHSTDAGVFIRSASARGHPGGLCAAAQDMVDVLDASGWPLILVETVGAGQSETEITNVVDITVVISAPGLGDDVQALKAGILEIADVLVVNKSDLVGADQTARQLESMLSLRSPSNQNVPIQKVASTIGLGIEELKDALEASLKRAKGARQEKRQKHKSNQARQRFAI